MSEGPLSDNESEGSRGRTFHRSISMGTNGAPWSRREGDGRVIMMRKRNNSSGETASGKSLCCCVEQVEMSFYISEICAS